jgi:Fic family protein
VTYEQLRWQPSTLGGESASRPTQPYRAAVAAEIADVRDISLSPATRALATEAATEIARFDQQISADLPQLSTALRRVESAASSRIENVIASAEEVGLAELGDAGSESATLIVANGVAVETAAEHADHLGGGAILAVHKALLGSAEPGSAGKWRTVQNWIGVSSSSPHEATFVPPHPDRVPPAIRDLERFLAREDLPALVQAAVAHAQFETIHPFTDGNGRTGRALVHSVLRAKELTRYVAVPVSAGLLADTRRYFEALTAYRVGDPEPIVERLANASFAAINNGRALVDELHSVRASWDDAISARRGASAWRLADMLLSRPVVDSPLVQRQLGVTAPAALGAIEKLVEAALLVKIAGGQRYRRYSAPRVLEALDAFATRAGRRGRF